MIENHFKKQIIVLLLGLAAFCGILLMPLPEGMTESAQRMFAVVALMSIWWVGEGTSLAVTAMLPLVLFPLLGIMPSKQVAPNYANHLIFLFLGGFMIALAMEKWNFHKRLALWIINAMGTDPKRIVLGFMIATAFLSMWISNTASTMMMLPVAMAVVRQIALDSSLNGERNAESQKQIESGLGLVLMLGLAYSASIGGVGTPIGTPPNIVFAGFYKKLFPENPEISFFKWMTMALPIVLVFIPITWVYLCRFVSPFPMSQIEGGESGIIQQELDEMGSMSRAEKIVAAVFCFTAFLWIFRQPIVVGDFILPGWSNLFENPKYLHDSTVAMAMGLLLLVMPVNGVKGLTLNEKTEWFALDWKTVQSKTPWGILILFGGGFALAAGFGVSGLDKWIGSKLTGVSDWPLWLTVLVICLAVTFLTELTSNTATTTMILPILGMAAVAATIHPLFFMVPATLAASFAFMLPVATPPNAIVFGSGWVSIPKMSRAGLILNLIGAGIVTTAVLVLVKVLFL
ncbi:MAG: SLC13/DASS family transporter [Nitrospina sp.]|nr:SLC13/DASS family transporter [Nitrospina sp.]MBT6716496.1 SLC13/DASS family transporter [Nitrospina sp.]